MPSCGRKPKLAAKPASIIFFDYLPRNASTLLWRTVSKRSTPARGGADRSNLVLVGASGTNGSVGLLYLPSRSMTRIVTPPFN
jgi:hypothetical protein